MRELSKIGTREVAYAAVASALSAAFLAVGFYLQLAEFLWYFLATMMIMIPLTRGYIRGALFAYAVSSLLGLLLCAFQFYFILPYVVFMGLHPVVNAFMDKQHFNVWVGHLIKAVWFDAAVYLIIRFTQLFLFIDLRAGGWTLAIVLGVSTLVYFFYDFAIRLVSRSLQRRISGTTRKK